MLYEPQEYWTYKRRSIFVSTPPCVCWGCDFLNFQLTFDNVWSNRHHQSNTFVFLPKPDPLSLSCMFVQPSTWQISDRSSPPRSQMLSVLKARGFVVNSSLCLVIAVKSSPILSARPGPLWWQHRGVFCGLLQRHCSPVSMGTCTGCVSVRKWGGQLTPPSRPSFQQDSSTHQGSATIELHHRKCVSRERKQADIFKPRQTNGYNSVQRSCSCVPLLSHTSTSQFSEIQFMKNQMQK